MHATFRFTPQKLLSYTDCRVPVVRRVRAFTLIAATRHSIRFIIGNRTVHILGVTHPISWNPAACLISDGQLVAFAEEERFTRLKHAPHAYPARAIAYCLEKAGLEPDDINITAIGFDKPNAQHARAAEARSYIDGTLAEADQFGFFTSLALIYGDTHLDTYGERRYYDHHLCHATSAAIPSGMDRTNVITLDGWGGRASGSLGWYDRDRPIQTFAEIDTYRSWGMLYELVTEYLGFRCHSGEGKTMGLASYGRVDRDLLPDFCEPPFGLPDIKRYEIFLRGHIARRRQNDAIEDWHRDLAATLQSYYELSIVNIARFLCDKTHCGNFALAGGVALNCSGNGRLAQQDFVDALFIQPASHDGGTALGAAILAHRDVTGHWPEFGFHHAYWGPDFTPTQVRAALDFAKAPYDRCDSVEAAAQALARNEIVGWFQGASEVGPRALGNRSILANPGVAANLHRVNAHVKRRETWRPLAPSVRAERFHDVFDAPHASPFMLVAAHVKAAWKARLPAVVHVDGSARPQAVSAHANALYHRLIDRFEQLTGLPAVLNTSFNLDDEPLVNTPEHAIATFYRSGIDTLVIGDFIVRKQAQ